MTSNFENPSDRPRDDLERDRFELLSAYLDGEVTPTERRQVQWWLNNDLQTQQLYKRLLKLRQGLHNLKVPVEQQQSPQQLSDAVFAKIEQRQQHRRIWAWSTGAIAAVFVGAVSGIFFAEDTPVWQFAQQIPGEQNNSEQLMIALDRPAVAIPTSIQKVTKPSLKLKSIETNNSRFN